MTGIMDRQWGSGPAGAIGGSLLRADAVDKVTGRACYADDIVLPGLLVGRVVRSPHHHARLVALDTSRAAALPGVVCVLTAADVPGENGFGGYSRDEPVLAPIGTTVKMRGAPVALVVAASAGQARAALEAIRAEYELLPHTFSAEDALRAEAPSIYPQGNLLTSAEAVQGNVEAVLAGSEVVVDAEYRTAWQEHSALEREAVLAYYDESGRLTVAGGTHEPHWQQQYIAAVLALPPAQIRVIAPPTGGSFGGRQDPWPLIGAALMAYHARRPVRLAYSRRESFDASPKRHPYRMRYRAGATGGRLTGFQARIDANTGGYDAHGQYLPGYAVVASGGAYRWQAADSRAQTVYTNGPKSGQFRGFGTPQPTFALECALDELSQRLGLDPLEFRLQNALRPGDVTFLGYPSAEPLGYVEVLEAIRPRYRALLAEAAAFNAGRRGRLRAGVGLAGMWYRFGKSGLLRVEAHAELAAGGRLVIYCSAPDYGQGTNTVLSQLAADAFGVPRGQVELVNADTALTPDSGIQGASRSTYWVGNAVRDAAHALKFEIQGLAAEILDCPPDDLLLAGDAVVSRTEPVRSVSLREVAEEFDRIGKPRRVIGAFDPSPLFPAETRPEYVPIFVTGAQAAYVQVDLDTGVVDVLRVVAAHDVGRAINPLDARGQVQGAIVMGIGTALMEEYLPGVTAGLSDYYLPTADSTPEMEVILVEVPSLHGPLGAKGLGEAAILPTAPALVNAVSRAIGARVRELPATPERVLAHIRRAGESTVVP